jgi:starch synthase
VKGRPLHLLSVASECFPLVKTGGLADVVGALPRALAHEGVTVETLLPGYPAVMDAIHGAPVLHRYADLMGGPATIRAGVAAGLALYVLDAPHLFARAGNPYMDAEGKDWPDNVLRFGALCRVAADLARGIRGATRPDVLHLHDWQAGLVPAYLRFTPGLRVPTVMTVHNLAFQGRFPAESLSQLGLPAEAYTMDGVEYYGGVGFLKAGLALADRVTTVSPSYAAEIRTSEQGMGLDGLLRLRGDALSGILNGLDVEVWNPAHDEHVSQRYDARRLAQRAVNKAALQQRMGLAEEPRTLLFGVVSRLTWQKGMDLLLAALPELVASGAQLSMLGSGDAALEAGFADAAAAYPGRVAVLRGYDEAMAHAIQGGCDALLVPSRFEPCGLTQLQALRYGVIPVVARTGGLADTVVDANEMALAARAGTGVVFSPVTRDALLQAIARTRTLYAQPTVWRGLQRRAMATDVSWARPAARYAALYRSLV